METAADRTLRAAFLVGQLHPDLDALTVELVRAAARSADAAGDDAGKLGYATAVLSKLLPQAGLDPRSLRRKLDDVDVRQVERALREVASTPA